MSGQARTHECLCLALLMTLLAATPALAARPRPASGVEIDVRVYAPATIPEESLVQMRGIAERLLNAAGLATRWHDCSALSSEPACAPPGTNVVIVRFVDGFRRGTCGAAMRSELPGGLVSIDSGCVSAVGHAIRSIKEMPVLVRVRDGDILGVVLAHEIAHAFGQSHTKAGIMRRLYTPIEWEQLATGRLAFSTSQGLALRAAVAPVVDHTAARH